MTSSTGRFAEPISLFWSAILNASAEIVKDELTPKDVAAVAPSTTSKSEYGSVNEVPSPFCILFQDYQLRHDLSFPIEQPPKL